jgi:hypothetical protein
MFRFMAVILALFLVGCVPCSENSLTSPGESRGDSELFGTWFWSEAGETGFIHIGKSWDSNLLRLLMVDIKEGGAMERSEFSAHLSFLEGNRYLNLKQVAPKAECGGYLFVKYGFEGDALVLFPMDSAVVERAVKSGVLKGEVKKSGSSSMLRITAGQKELQAFVLSHDRELFPERKVLARLELPESPQRQTTPDPK